MPFSRPHMRFAVFVLLSFCGSHSSQSLLHGQRKYTSPTGVFPEARHFPSSQLLALQPAVASHVRRQCLLKFLFLGKIYHLDCWLYSLRMHQYTTDNAECFVSAPVSTMNEARKKFQAIHIAFSSSSKCVSYPQWTSL